MASWIFPSPLLIGITIGFCSSLFGAFVDYLISRVNNTNFNSGGLMLIAAGIINSFLGLSAITYSIIVMGSVLPSLILGLGVLVGFGTGFLLIALLWIWMGNKKEPL